MEKSQLKTILYHLLIGIIGIAMFYPVLWMLSSSFKVEGTIFRNAHNLIPEAFTLSNYVSGWAGFGGTHFGIFFRNSFIITLTATAGQIFTSAAVGYGFARIKFRGKAILFALVISTLLLPQQVVMIPQYIMFSFIGWINSYKPLILPRFFAMPFFIFLMYQFIQGIPKELDEAAKIDGCGVYSIFFKIILPNIKPALITTFIFQFYWTWQDFFGPLLYLQSANKYPVSLGLKLFSDPSTVTNWGGMFAMSVLSLLPVLVIFIVFQRYLVEGISTTGLKG
ncbi:carbohydrate ABC transporter membrane protein 2 (CUT1 family) [Halanaerobium saccharolyticum]|uniref:Carbohydrate ABC transporter membrane protein 2 (CUT1 family) n=1 Tax=Halanaerobium saccharolyticum TaxID=43595 RepID=A0A4V3G4S0_9FIRM|nr:carbohydrate ABC transporter permease [Halanaerobium saccharolyticum]RAK06899.1 carbohydrate ABC transporter membrane protein 2 (CUT1 family) [Halanaerobium saccharolyticum]TDW01509.1 carbohydrate ABC transporter membrane protein 2 (CUT1 family) [Halanaerobium saccharolyticum]TDX52870.1 carbohydrate ABC transporter membrane protein 2 (CUT1 family) [Halanaerobium saccharolyticum]